MSLQNRRRAALVVLCLAQLVVVLDNTVLNVALPALVEDLDASTAELQWVVSSYSLAQCGLLLTAGCAADRFGRRRLLVLGLLVFGLSSLAAALATSPVQLVLARACMGVGGALLSTATLAAALQLVTPDERPRAIGAWAAASAFGFAAGPAVGGLILAHAWWGAVFLVHVPLAAACLVAVLRLVPESRQVAPSRFDIPGAVLSTAGITALVLGIILVPEKGLWSASVTAAFVAAAVLLVAFVAWQRRTEAPLLALPLLRNPRFRAAVIGVVLITLGSGGVLFLLSQQLQLVAGHSAAGAGLRMAPFAVTILLVTATGVSAACIRRLGPPLAIALGMGMFALGCVTVSGSGDGLPLLTGFVVMGVGCGLANPAIIEAIMSAIPAEQAGAGAGIDSTMTEIGSSLGVACLGAVLSVRFSSLLPPGTTEHGSLPEAFRSGVGRDVVLDAFGSGLRTGQLAGALLVLVGGFVTSLLLVQAQRRRAPDPHPAALEPVCVAGP